MDVQSANLAQWQVNRFQLDLPRGDERTQLRAAAQEFESLFAKQMLDSMRDTLNKEDDLFNGGMAQDIFEDMLYEEYGRLIARTGTLGIADTIVAQYERSLGDASSTVDAGATQARSRAAALYDSV
ncbi:MAG: rod-binding protein [Spirochaetota bacterium]